jgi:diketogulonate reductase-like aldo/keto reductase
LFLLHVPFEDEADDLLAWKVFESYVPARISTLGVSNFPLPAFEKLYNAATIKPEVVQNRFNANRGYDVPLRNFLADKGIIYQAFALLKPPNKDIISFEVVARFSEEFKVTKEVAFYILVLGLGKISIVSGTTSEEHMKLDIEKLQELLGDEKTVEAIKVYLPEFEANLIELSKLKA